ncbi:MAG: methionine--tRNA ligase [Pseudomonadota bacterium]|nr:methionine--tRNA ligase [Pseudomonadota bacterium]
MYATLRSYMTQKRQIIVTNALPYANAPLHLGHMLEYTQTDIWVRFQRMRKNDCYYMSADDAHGTPIMLTASQKGISPEEHIDKIRESHEADFKDFLISVDNYYTTHSPENQKLCEDIFKILKRNKHIEEREISQAFDQQENLFLADRYIKGTCPNCLAENQYGDNCEACGATYKPTDLINPISVLSGTKPVERESKHYFFKLSEFNDFLKDWLSKDVVTESIANKLNEWLEEGLTDWDISRDEPYFGFLIPGEDTKYFYVWLDAPIGYIAAFKNYCNHSKLDFNHFWGKDSVTELYHFIGKDIINFHALFWPSMLKSAGIRLPTKICVHGFVTINGLKMSKSRGTFILARDYLDNLDPDFLRYYYACKLSNSAEDLDLNLEDFVQKINSDLVGKVVNLASRCSKFITKGNDGYLHSEIDDKELWNIFSQSATTISENYENRNFSKATREIIKLTDLANEYISDKQPWVLNKELDNKEQVLRICSLGINLFRLIMIYLKPITPNLVRKAEDFLNETLLWDSSAYPLLNHKIKKFEPMISRIQNENIEAMLNSANDGKA